MQSVFFFIIFTFRLNEFAQAPDCAFIVFVFVFVFVLGNIKVTDM